MRFLKVQQNSFLENDKQIQNHLQQGLQKNTNNNMEILQGVTQIKKIVVF